MSECIGKGCTHPDHKHTEAEMHQIEQTLQMLERRERRKGGQRGESSRRKPARAKGRRPLPIWQREEASLGEPALMVRAAQGSHRADEELQRREVPVDRRPEAGMSLHQLRERYEAGDFCARQEWSRRRLDL